MPVMPLSRIKVFKEAFKFSAGHFTIFSATERENLHGHNFRVEVEVASAVGADGLAFDYGLLKRCVGRICDSLDERFLLPGRSPHLKIIEEGGYVVGLYADERIPFLPRDVLVLPVANITLEALSGWLLTQLLDTLGVVDIIEDIELRTFSGPGQYVAVRWTAPPKEA